MGIFNNLFKKKGTSEEITIGGKTIKVNPEAMVFSQNALVKYENRDFKGAINDFTNAIRLHPTNQNFYTMRGTAYDDLADYEKAKEDLVKALGLENKNHLASFRLGMIYFKNKDLENAIKWLKISYDNAPNKDISDIGLGSGNILFVSRKVIAGNLGNFLTQVKRFEEGFKYLDEAIEIDPNYSNPYLAKGLALVQLGENINALDYLKKASVLGNVQATTVIPMIENLISQESQNNENKDLELEFVFESSDHLRYENEIHVAGPHPGGAPRAIKVEPNIEGDIGYTVTLFSLDGGTARVQAAPKQMKLESINNSEIKLVGFGYDQMGSPFSDYGLTICHEGGNITKCKLHMFDRNVDIEYLK